MILVISACNQSAAPTQDGYRVVIEGFEFSSGNPYHPEGFGEWQFEVDLAGKISVRHIIQEEINDFGTFSLSPQEKINLWEQIQAADFQRSAIPEKSGMPDESQFIFVLHTPEGNQAYRIWQSDIAAYEKIAALVDQISILIEKYTGEEPIL